MKWNILNQPLGSVCSSGYTTKKEIPIAIPIAMAAGSLFSSIFGGSQSAKAAGEAQQQLLAERTRTEAERMRAKNQQWLDTASGQNTMRAVRDMADREYKRISGAAAVGGATEAAKAAQKELANQQQAEVIAQANAAFEDKKDAVDASYRQQLSGINQQQIAAKQAKGNAIAQAAGGVSSALMQGAMATFGGTKLGQQLMGVGSPAGGGVAPASTSTPSMLQQMNQNYKTLNPYILQWLQGSGTV